MNNSRRKRLEKAIELFEQAKEILSEVQEEEQDAYDNMPESFQSSEK